MLNCFAVVLCTLSVREDFHGKSREVVQFFPATSSGGRGPLKENALAQYVSGQQVLLSSLA